MLHRGTRFLLQRARRGGRGVKLRGTGDKPALTMTRGVVRALAITGPHRGVDLGAAAAERVWIHDTGRYGIQVPSFGAEKPVVRESLIERATEVGVMALESLSIERSVVRGTRAASDRTRGRGVQAIENAKKKPELRVSRSVFNASFIPVRPRSNPPVPGGEGTPRHDAALATLDRQRAHQPQDRAEAGAEPGPRRPRLRGREVDAFGHAVAERGVHVREAGAIVLRDELDHAPRDAQDDAPAGRELVHASADQHHQLRAHATARTGHPVRQWVKTRPKAPPGAQGTTAPRSAPRGSIGCTFS